MMQRWEFLSAAGIAGIFLSFIMVHLAAHIIGVDSGQSISSDAQLYHFPELQHFLLNPIGFESSPGFSGPIPGYHWFQTALARVLGASTLEDALPLIMAIHFLVALAAVAALIVATLTLSRAHITPFVLILIIVLDYYFIQSGYYFNTETPAYAFLTLLLSLLAMNEKKPSAAYGGGAGAAGLGLTLSRHSTLPALVGVALYFGIARQWHALARFSVFGVIIALIILSYLSFWGGLVSPFWQERGVSSGLFPHSLAHVFALTGAFAPFFFVALREQIAEALSTQGYKIALASAATVLVVLWLIADTNASAPDERRFSIVWRFAALGPEIGAKSPVVLGLMLISAPLFALMIHEMIRAGRLFPEIAVTGCYLSAQILQNLSFQRYVEVPLLIGIALFTARYAKDNAWTLSALFSLALIWGGLSVIRFLGFL